MQKTHPGCVFCISVEPCTITVVRGCIKYRYKQDEAESYTPLISARRCDAAIKRTCVRGHEYHPVPGQIAIALEESIANRAVRSMKMRQIASRIQSGHQQLQSSREEHDGGGELCV